MRLLGEIFGGLVVGALIVVFAVSFAAIVFSGPAAHLLDRGVGATLLAATVLALGGALLFSYRAVFVIPQDISAVLLAGGAGAIALGGAELPDDALFATIAGFLAVSAAVTGLCMAGLGAFRLTSLLRYIPYTVKGGFLAATGYLLIAGAIGMLTGQAVDLRTAGSVLAPDMLARWLPWIAVALAMLAVTRLVRGSTVFPLSLVAICAGFYLVVAVSGIGLSGAREAGWLLGHLLSGDVLAGLGTGVFAGADWGLVLAEAPTILTVMVMSVLGGALNLSGIEVAVEREFDSDRDFTAMGLCNLFAAPTGGVFGFPGISATLLGHKFGVRTGLAGAAAAGVCLGVALFGTSVLEVLPLGLFAAILAFLGFDLMLTWTWSERRRLGFKDFSIILSILAVAALVGFLEALAFGLALSAVFFIVSYAELDFVRRRSDLGVTRSTVEREAPEIDYLAQAGRGVRIFEFTGYLFFGTAARLKAVLDRELAAEPRPEMLILDFARVPGIDPSASQSLLRVAQACGKAGVALVVSGVIGEARAKDGGFGQAPGAPPAAEFATLAEALEFAEERLLARRPAAAPGHDPGAFLDRLRAAHPGVDFDRHFETVTLEAGDTLLRMGDRSERMYLLKSGTVTISAPTGGAQAAVIARLRSGALIGEISHYGDLAHSADATAEERSELYVIDKARLADLGRDLPEVVQSFHALAAMYLARRVSRSTQVLRTVLD